MDDFREFDRSRYRFELDHSKPRKKLRCPQCGKDRCFTPYVDVTTGNIVGEEYGICDHASKCGYKKYPTPESLGGKELFVNGNEVMKKFRQRVEPDVANKIPLEKVMPTLNPLKRSNLFDYLSDLFGIFQTTMAFERYKVGMMNFYDWGRCPVFWQIDKNWVVRTGKIMSYDDTGHRIKEPFDRIYWVHTFGGHDYILRQCLFGEHLLNFYPQNATIHIVESEKTAIICNIVYPDRLFMSCGGLYGLREETMSALRGRKIVLYPDKGEANRKWREKVARDLPSFNIEVSDFIEKKDVVGDKDDIGDFFIIRQQRINEKTNG